MTFHNVEKLFFEKNHPLCSSTAETAANGEPTAELPPAPSTSSTIGHYGQF